MEEKAQNLRVCSAFISHLCGCLQLYALQFLSLAANHETVMLFRNLQIKMSLQKIM